MPFYLPLMEKYFDWQTATLSGESTAQNTPVLIPKMWMNGRYQKQYEASVKDRSPVRDLLIRTRNQIEFDVLSTIGNQTILLGKEDMLFSKNYVDAAFRKNTKSEAWIIDQVAKLEVIVDYFEKKGISFLVLTPPSKASVYPENLPTTFLKNKSLTTNRSIFIAAFKDKEIPFIDFDFFIGYESKKGLPVYPQAGLHWNYLGAALAADTIQKYLTYHYHLKLPQFIWSDTIPLHTNFESTDTELLRSMNLLKVINLRPEPYPEIRYTSQPDSLQPKAIVIGDSYYQILLKKGYHEHLFQTGSPYWHYFGAEGFKQNDSLKKFNRKKHQIMEKLERSELIILSASEANMTKFGFGFIDFVYAQITAKNENK